MATAAVLDASRKESKKRELDQQLDDAKEQLEDLQRESPDDEFIPRQPYRALEMKRKRIQAMRKLGGKIMKRKVAAIKRDAYTKVGDQAFEDVPPVLGSYTADVSAVTFAETLGSPSPTKEEIFRSICLWPRERIFAFSDSRQARERHFSKLWVVLGVKKHFRVSVNQVQEDLSSIRALLSLERNNSRLKQREPRTEVHFSKAVDMHVALVDQLLREVYADLDRPPALDSGLNFIRMLKSDGFPRYLNALTEKTDRRGPMNARLKMSDANLSIMKSWTPESRQTMVSKICHNFLVCEYLPGIHAYNALIHGFTQVGETRLAQIVVDSFLFRSHLLATKGTVLSLICHYRFKQDVVGFHVLMRRMFGYDSRGLVRRRTLDDVSTWPSLRRWVQMADVNISADHATERFPADACVYQALLRALIDLKMLPSAAKVFVVCLQEQISLSVVLLDDLLRACIDYFHHVAAGVLLRGFLDHMDQIMSMLRSAILDTGLSGRLRRFIILFNSQMLPGESLPGESLPGESLPSKTDDDKPRIRRFEAANRLDLALTVRAFQPHVYFVQEQLAYFEQAMKKPLPLGERLHMATRALNRLAENQHIRMGDDLRFGRLARRAWLLKQVFESHVWYRTCVRELIDCTTPPGLRDLFGQRERVNVILQRHLQMRTPGSSLHRLSTLFHAYDALDEELNWALRDALSLLTPKPEGQGNRAPKLGPLQKKLLEFIKELADEQAPEDGDASAEGQNIPPTLDSFFT